MIILFKKSDFLTKNFNRLLNLFLTKKMVKGQTKQRVYARNCNTNKTYSYEVKIVLFLQHHLYGKRASKIMFTVIRNLLLPYVSTSTNTIQKSMVSVGVPHNNFPF